MEAGATHDVTAARERATHRNTRYCSDAKGVRFYVRGKAPSIRDLEALYYHAVSAAQEERTDEAIRRFNSLRRMMARRRFSPMEERARAGGGRSAARPGRRRFRSHRTLAAACRMNLATCYAEKGMLKEATAHLEAALKMDPHNCEAACQLGYAYERSGESAKAIQLFNAALRSVPDCAEAHAGLSRCHLAGGQYTQAMRECETALRLSPHCCSARADLAIALRRRGRMEEALRIAEPLREGLPDDPVRVHELADLWLAADQPENAVQALEWIRTPDTYYEPAVKTLAEAYVALGEYERAVETCATSRATGAGRIPILDLMLIAWERLGDLPNALACATELVQAAPLDAHAHFRLGTILQRVGDFKNAMARHAMAMELAAVNDAVRESAEEAVETLDAIQLQQIVALASANVVFRAKLGRDVEATLREYDFRLTDAAIGMLDSMDMDDLAPASGHVDRRMSH